MSEPEISRRCPECGASIRVRAFFCPQCGQASKGAPEPKGAPDSAVEERQNPEAASREANTRREADKQLPPGRRKTDMLGAEEKNVRRANAVRKVIDDKVLPPVERLRRVSNLVLDEAGYDPGLRFLLVAVVLFVLFLVLLALSKWLG